MHEPKLGFDPEKNGERDAVHVPIIAVVIGFDNAARGERVGIKEIDGRWTAIKSDGIVKTVGVLDPWSGLEAFVKGHSVWLCLDPGSIASLNHNWTHPAITSDDAMSDAEAKLRVFASSIGVDYNELLERAQDHLDHDSVWCEGGRFDGIGMPDDFWENFGIVTGQKVVFDKPWQGYFFRCSC